MDKFETEALAQRLKRARQARGWTLEELAEASSVSRAMISRIERGEASPTAAILSRLAGGLNVTIGSLFQENAAPGGNGRPALSRAQDSPAWRDPESGYRRRNVSPGRGAGAVEIVEVEFPAKGRVVMEAFASGRALAQYVWILEGRMTLAIAEASTELVPGDCLFMRLDAPIAFHNPGETTARYGVVLFRSLEDIPLPEAL